jgi:hypothetical protein
MSDIVERLRHDAEKARRNWPEVFCVSEDLAEEAADEIEKLRAALREIKRRTQHAHPLTYVADYWRIANEALGETE